MDACRSLMTAYTTTQSGDLHTGSISSVPGCVSRFNVGWALPADPGRWAEPTQEKGVLGRPADSELVHELSSQTATSRAPPARVGVLHRKTLRHQKWHRLCAIVRPIIPF
jgi:hypothetical protein